MKYGVAVSRLNAGYTLAGIPAAIIHLRAWIGESFFR